MSNGESYFFISLIRDRKASNKFNPTIFRVLGNVTGAIVNVDDYKTHENQDGSVDRTRTDLYIHLVNRQDNSILEVPDVLALVDRNIEKLDTLFKEFNVLDTQPAQAQAVVQVEQAGTTLWLLALTLFLGALLILCIALCLSQRASFRRQLKAAKASPFGELRANLSFPQISTEILIMRLVFSQG